MNTLFWTPVLWCVTCTGSRIFMSVSEGSSAVLPCDWSNKSDTQPSKQSPYIEWRTISGTVFERLGEKQYQGEGYEGRVDVPEDNLKMGNCSLVLKDVTPGDAGVYESYLLVNRVKRALSSRRVFIQSVELSVGDLSEMFSGNVPAASSAGVISVSSQIIIFTILSNILT